MAENGVFVEESLESLESSLQEYEASLKSVESAAAALQSDPELTKLVKDLEELVQVYRARVELARGTKALAEKEAEDLEEDLEEDLAVAAAEQSEDVPDIRAKPEALLQRACYALYEGEWYTATVTAVQQQPSDEGGGGGSDNLTATITYIGWGNEATLPVESLRFIAAHPNLAPNTSGYALSTSDGLWYRAVILRKSDDGEKFVVRFKETAQTEQLPFDRVAAKLPSVCVSPTVGAASRKRRAAEVVTPGGYRIPEKLVVKPTDSEKMRQVKKRKVEVIKRAQRKQIKEKEASERADSWKQHAARTSQHLRQLAAHKPSTATGAAKSQPLSFAARVRFSARPSVDN